MGDRWNCQTVVCIKEYKTLKIGIFYDIKGRGNLEFNNDPEVEGRKGYGFCIQDSKPPPGRWNPPSKDRIKWYYFTEQEMSEYFVAEGEYYKAYKRNEKIKKILS
jgi:hypothetical protein